MKKITDMCEKYKTAILVVLVIVLIGITSRFIREYSTDIKQLDPQIDFIQETITTKNSKGDAITITYPKSGVETLDILIAKTVKLLNESALKTGMPETYTSQVYTYGKYNSIGFSNTNMDTKAIPFLILNTDKYRSVTFETFFAKENMDNLILEILNTLTMNNIYISGDMRSAVVYALTQNNFRMAENGLVIMFPSKIMSIKGGGSSYYELLVPKNAIEKFLR